MSTSQQAPKDFYRINNIELLKIKELEKLNLPKGWKATQFKIFKDKPEDSTAGYSFQKEIYFGFGKNEGSQVIDCVNGIWKMAEYMNWHPRVEFSWGKVTINQATSAKFGGISQPDIGMLEQYDKIQECIKKN